MSQRTKQQNLQQKKLISNSICLNHNEIITPDSTKNPLDQYLSQNSNNFRESLIIKDQPNKIDNKSDLNNIPYSTQRVSNFQTKRKYVQIDEKIFQQLKLEQSERQSIQQQINKKIQQIEAKAYQKAKATKVDATLVGMWIGVSISLLILLIAMIVINDIQINGDTRFSRDFTTWRGVALFIFYVWILGFDMWIFQKYRIYHYQIFKFNSNHLPHAISIFKIAGLQTSVFLICFLFYIFSIADVYKIPSIESQYFALISWASFLLFLLVPIPYFSNKGRFFALKLLLDSILSPFYGVTFPISWLTDQLVSMAIPLKDVQYTICYYTNLDQLETNFSYCLDNNRVPAVVVVAIIVCVFRIIQCMRQGYDKGQYWMTPFMFNSLKYLATIFAAIFAFLYKIGNQWSQAIWLTFAVISSFYSFCWDIKMDWGLLQKNEKHIYLRKILIYGSARNYYFIILANFIMRWIWILTFAPSVSNVFANYNLYVLVIAMIEIIRRGIWNLLRFQKQHIHILEHEQEKKYEQDDKKETNKRNNKKLQIKLLRFYKSFFRFYKKEKQNSKKSIQLREIKTKKSKSSYYKPLAEIYSLKQNQLIQYQEQYFLENIYQLKKYYYNQQELNQMSSLMEQVLKQNPRLVRKMKDDQKDAFLKYHRYRYLQNQRSQSQQLQN